MTTTPALPDLAAYPGAPAELVRQARQILTTLPPWRRPPSDPVP